MTKKINAAVTIFLLLLMTGCAEFDVANYETGPQQLFDCKNLTEIVRIGATKDSIESSFGLPAMTMEAGPDGTILKNLGVYNSTKNITYYRQRQLVIQYDINKRVKGYKLYTMTHGVTKEIHCN